MTILRIKPIFKEMIWGGSALKKEFSFAESSESTGECWAISAHKHGDCSIENPEFSGNTLRKIYTERRELFGDIQSQEFPLLAKIIDASKDLSIQVHPDDSYAKKQEDSLGKNEAWYILKAKEDASIVYGHHAKTKKEIIARVASHEYVRLLKRQPIKEGDFFYIPSGTVHAICSGTLVYEVQQSSDITYRLYDYDRKDSSGNLRELHTEKALDVITVPSMESINKPVREVFEHYTVTTYLSNEFFTVRKLEVNGGKTTIRHKVPFSLLTVIEGNGHINGESIKKGDSVIVCSDEKQMKIEGQIVMMISSL